MKFFDSKEEVINIRITPLGKQALVNGTFKPKYYSFHDDNVVYDSKYAGFDEVQNNIEERIQDETPIVRPWPNFSSLEIAAMSLYDERMVNVNVLDMHSPISPRTELGSQFAPKWNLQFYDGTIISSSAGLSGSNQVSHPITQLDVEQTYQLSIGSPDELVVANEDADAAIKQKTIFSDGTFLQVTPENIILDIEEKYTPFENENFDIAIYVIEYENSTEKARRLKFKRPTVYIKDDLLLDQPIESPSDSVVDENYVEYYFDVLMDSQITTQDICNAISQLKSKGYYLDSDFQCPDDSTNQFPNIYKTSVTEEDIEDC